jgi:hypothetical protein
MPYARNTGSERRIENSELTRRPRLLRGPGMVSRTLGVTSAIEASGLIR